MNYLLHHLLHDAANAHPDRIAVVDDPTALTYADLEQRANRVAHLLLDLGVRRGDRIGLYLDKSSEAMAAVYGVLKTGAVYVPFDPEAPVARLAYITRDCGITCLVTGVEKAEAWAELIKCGAPITTLAILNDHERSQLDEARERLPGGVRVEGLDALHTQPVTPPALSSVSLDLAYILYTSGSTGEPKGVMLSHRNGLAFVEWVADEFELRSDDRLSSHAPLHFDLSILDIFAASKAAAAVVLVPQGASVFPVELGRFIVRERISVWYSVPSVLSMMTMMTRKGGLSRGDVPDLRLVLFAGEVFPTKYLRRLMTLLPGVRFCNLYGPTETNVCTWYDVPPIADDQTQPVPIGKAIADVEVFAVTVDERLAGSGEIGELWVRGPTVMQGYWGDRRRTDEKLVQNPFVPEVRDLAYKTGDLVREDEDGNYRLLGRRDDQIKSRGYRIELGEIEAALYGNPSVVECAVLAIPDELVTNRIAAVVVVRARSEQEGLTEFCAARVPGYMVPETFEFRDGLPRTSTGKVDRKRLADELAARLSGGRAPEDRG